MTTKPADIIIDIHDVTVTYDKRAVLWDVDCQLPAGKLVAIIGPNGAGKTTLLKAIMGLVPLASGEVRIYGESIEQVRNRIAYVPQRESVDWTFPVNVLDVVLMGRYGKLPLFHRPGRTDHDIALKALERVGLQDYTKRHISKLSGGQQQRVFLARALAQEPDLYLMDEPFSGVDIATEEKIIQVLQQLRDEGKTVLLVHHDLQTVQSRFDWVVMVNMRKIADGPTQEVFTNENLNTTFGAQLNILSKVADLSKQTGIIRHNRRV
jgi:manganese/zinc/iron transport system ATP- binding protein